MSAPKHFEWTIQAKDSGKQLLAFLQDHFGSLYSGRFLKKMIEQRFCSINGRVQTFASTVLGRGDRLKLALHSTAPLPLTLEEACVLFEDEFLLVYNKPANINCDEQGIVALLQKSRPTCQLVHRLDRHTTGALIFAKSAEVKEQMIQQFKAFLVEKYYYAIVDKVVKKLHGAIENYLGKKHSYSGQSIWGAVAQAKGLHAKTVWKCLKQGKNCSLLLCYPKTGRTHQLRVHLAEIGHPILGDSHYAKEFTCPYKPLRYLLHAEKIRFFHPVTKVELEIHAPLPDDFTQAKQQLFVTKQ